MKAAVFYGPEDIRVEKIKKPIINDDEVLVKVKYSAVCGTDVRIFLGKKTKGVRKNSVIGHEISGVVVETGKNIKNFKVDDKVGIIPVIPCGNCHYCMNSMENICENRTAIGYEYDGGFAEFVKIPQSAISSGNLVKLPDDIALKDAVIIEPLACCMNGNNKAGVKLNDTVVIIGGGPIGLLHAQLAKIAGAKNVILSELLEGRRIIAEKLKVDYIVNPEEESLEEVVANVTKNLGADVVIMAIGVPQIINQVVSLLKKGGTLNLFAGFTNNVLSEIDPNIIHYNELTINGTSSLTRSYYYEAMELLATGKIDVNSILSTEYDLEDINQAIHDVKNGVGMKSIITIN